ncbi:hypothetical protein [Limimaricola pyoseonensis]|uniref:Uncharacterized protein n=1 Tax=Limimaricola pyoseonensis TaxID=521013 RepID=A0A1G7GT62_9RHOB|nr:hypothetical protein [Limimaricola pyoseonensis]SDE91213.1 hypothetical protein SAMN04488567_2910 [Limimaricola pyoseonensis]
MTDQNALSGMAALSICEALLLALGDGQLLSESEIQGVLQDAATTHENATGVGIDVQTHRAVAGLIREIRVTKISVRHR